MSSTEGVDTSAATVNGQGDARSVTQRVNAALPANEAEYNLGRHWKHFKATIGLRDDSPTKGQLTFEVSADGKSVFKERVDLGQTQKVDVDLNSPLRLKLTVTYAGQDSTNSYYGTWGDAQLQG
ncbi:NPCBM/NEW2 domain-containing protein [Streptomyces platensis]|uniref:NPCBM/NEW2 domain-containing protein n=1 Tax=Streptomyces platensis TaxID=58346 RepID=UPI0037BBEC2C